MPKRITVEFETHEGDEASPESMRSVLRDTRSAAEANDRLLPIGDNNEGYLIQTASGREIVVVAVGDSFVARSGEEPDDINDPGVQVTRIDHVIDTDASGGATYRQWEYARLSTDTTKALKEWGVDPSETNKKLAEGRPSGTAGDLTTLAEDLDGAEVGILTQEHPFLKGKTEISKAGDDEKPSSAVG